MELKTLPIQLVKNGYTYTQVLRGNRSCIYEQRVSQYVVRFEVFLIKVKPETILAGKKLEAKERFPHDEAFGYWAWVYFTLNDAMKKYNQLENHEETINQ